MSSGPFIRVKGNKIKVTDLDKGLAQAQEMVRMHELAKVAAPKCTDVIYFPDAHAWWREALAKLQSLAGTHDPLIMEQSPCSLCLGNDEYCPNCGSKIQSD